MKKALLISGAFFTGALYAGAANPFGGPFFGAGAAAAWEKSWANFNKQMADLQKLSSSLPAQAQTEISDVLDAADDLSDTVKATEEYSAGIVIINGQVFFNGKPINAKGSSFSLVNGTLFIDGKEVDPATGDFKKVGARKPEEVNKVIRKNTVSVRFGRKR